MASPAQASQRPKGRGKISLLVLLIVLAVIVLTAFLTHRRGVIPVRVAVASRTTITSAIATNGKIEPELNFEAHAPAPTTIRRVLVKEGDKIHKGQLLLQLDDS